MREGQEAPTRQGTCMLTQVTVMLIKAHGTHMVMKVRGRSMKKKSTSTPDTGTRMMINLSNLNWLSLSACCGGLGSPDRPAVVELIQDVRNGACGLMISLGL